MEQILVLPPRLADDTRAHLRNLADNLQLVADLGYGGVALAVAEDDGSLTVAADARPLTAVTAVAVSRVGQTLASAAEPEAYESLRSGAVEIGSRRRTTRGISFVTSAHPVSAEGRIVAVVLQDRAEQVTEAPGRMEVAFMDIAQGVVEMLIAGPLSEEDGTPFVTRRRAGDGVMKIEKDGIVSYASPNAVNILQVAGGGAVLVGKPASELPGGSVAVAPWRQSGRPIAAEVEVGGRVLYYRTIPLPEGAAVLVEDVTQARRHAQELKVKEATIREVHHRVKNNLQTIASLLRIQSRRSGSESEKRALDEAVQRISSMAVVHEQLAASTEESVDFGSVARTVVDMVRSSVTSADAEIAVSVEGATGLIPANVATSLALVIAELVHNAIEHGLAAQKHGSVTVETRRLADAVELLVSDDGRGLPEGFSLESSANLGLAIVRTVVEDDLRGALEFQSGPGTNVRIRVPLMEED